MTTETRAEINRANAQKSTGPRTAEGKARSAMNASKHGITGQVTLMPGEDRITHDEFCSALAAAYAPEGPLETQIAHSIAETEWRLNRAAAVEQNIYANGFDGPEGNIDADHPEIHSAVTMAGVFVNQQRTFSNLTLYESRLQRFIQKNEARLKELQEERERATAAAVRQTEVLMAHAAGVGATIDPAPHFPPSRGFVFSNEKVVSIIDRHKRYSEACTFLYRRQAAEQEGEDGDAAA